jgi:hypothetical protein
MSTNKTHCIFDAAHARWLNVDEIVAILSNAHESVFLGTAESFLAQEIAPPPTPPVSGTLLLYDRVAVRNYKVDGHDWLRKRSNLTKIREDHVKLRHRGEYRIGGTYVHSAEVETFHRRVYRLIKTDKEKAEAGRKELVLVHYLDTAQAAKMPSCPSAIKKRGKASHPSSSSPTTFTSSSGTSKTRKRSAPMISADEQQQQQFNEPMPALPVTAHSSMSTLNGAMMSEIPKRIRTANSYAKVLEQQEDSFFKPLTSYNYRVMAEPIKQMPSLYQSLGWNSNGNAPAPDASSSSASTRATETSLSDLDDLNLNDIFDMFSSDAALCEGLESLIDPTIATMQSQAQGPMLHPPTFEMPVLRRPPRFAHYQKEVSIPEGKETHMCRTVTADDIPSVGV